MDTWSPVAQRLVERGYRVIRYDQRGHRSSTVGAEGVTVARLGADLRDVLEAFDVRHAVVAGHSMGGMAVQAFAIDHPDALAARVDRLVLVATASSSLKRPGLDRLVPFAVAGAATQRLLASPGGHVIVRRVFGRGAEAAAVRATRDAYVATAPDIRLACLRSIFDMDLREGRATIAAPTTVVVGARDRLTPPSHARGMARDIPGARLVELPHVGHMLPYEAPEEVTDLIAGAAQ
jgi:pimeloyl-ACP methyl ester carboxylesterase